MNTQYSYILRQYLDDEDEEPITEQYEPPAAVLDLMKDTSDCA